MPVAMMNFPEGTRFSSAKRAQRNSPYQNLLEPRIGGIGQVLYALGDELDALIDVTIVFPGRGGTSAPTLWQLLSPGRAGNGAGATGADTRPAARQELQDRPGFPPGTGERWVTQIWREKDELIAALEGSGSAGSGFSS